MERTVSPWHLGWTSGVGAGLWHGALSGVSGPGLAQLRFIYTAPNRGATRQTTPRASTWRPWEAKTPFPTRWRHGGVWDAPLCLHDVRLTLALRHALRDVTSGDTLNPVTEGLMRGETSMTWMTSTDTPACVLCVALTVFPVRVDLRVTNPRSPVSDVAQRRRAELRLFLWQRGYCSMWTQLWRAVWPTKRHHPWARTHDQRSNYKYR